MAGVFHKAMVWLGLAPDDEYDDYPYDPGMRTGPAPRPPMQQRPGPGPQRGPVPQQHRPQPRPQPGYEEEGFVSPRPPQGPQGRPSGTVRQIQPQAYRQQQDGGYDNPTVRPMRPTSAKPAVIAPGSFDDAKEIADRFKADQPVVMDLSGVDRDLSRRLIDFASGVCYALGGGMERVRPGGYLIIPLSVEVSDDERRRLSGR